MRLEKIHIQGFKDPNRVVHLEFSKEPITIVFGENGSGKTTLLKIIQAFLKNDVAALIKENVQEITVTYTNQSRVYKVKLIVDAIGNKTIINDLDDLNDFKMLNRSSSVLFGVNRGMIESDSYWTETINKALIDIRNREKSLSKKSIKNIDNIITLTDTDFAKQLDSFLLIMSKHFVVDNLKIEAVGNYVSNCYKDGQKALEKKIRDAFFHTIDNAMEIATNTEPIVFPKDFWTRFEQQKSLFQLVVNDLENSNTQRLLKAFIQIEQPNVAIETKPYNNNIFKSLILNLLAKSEEENIALKAVNALVFHFNKRLARGKQLVVNSEKTYIQLPEGGQHDLSDLSSGERHLLSFLALFLIIARGRNFFLIDEPEISMSMMWQRELLPLLSELSPESQIIVATHSPEIADGNTSFLKKLV
jgi:predicted ATPase